MENNIGNDNMIDFGGSSLYLPSVKIWNEHIRRIPFVKDHTAVPLAVPKSDYDPWGGPSVEDQYPMQNVSSSTVSKFRMPSHELAALSPMKSNDDHTTPLNTAFEVASRTRDMLNKLDGWKSLSLKAFPSPPIQTSGPGGYMIKSSSQFTTLDAKSDEAKNILQNIKDMAQILCPAEYGGISHFRVNHDDGELATRQSPVLRPYLNSNASPVSGTRQSRDVIPIQNKEMSIMDNLSSNLSMFQQNHLGAGVASSRINIIGGSSKQPLLSTPSQSVLPGMYEDNLGPVKSSVKHDDHQNVSQVLESYVGTEAAQRNTFVKMKALYEDLLAKLKPASQKATPDFYKKVAESTLRDFDDLYEDFEDGSYIPLSARRRPPLLPFVPEEPYAQATYGHVNEEVTSARKLLSNSMKDKHHEEWERETHNFLMKLNGGPRLRSHDRSSDTRPKTKRGRDEHKDHNSTSRAFTSNQMKYSSVDKSATSKSSSQKSFQKSCKCSPAYEGLSFYDGHNHNCKDCGISDLSVTNYLDHLLTPDHAKKISDLPLFWKVQKFDETLLTKSKTKTGLPIRAGANFLYPVTAGFFCQPCNKYLPDKNSTLSHLISQGHNDECGYYTNLEKQRRRRVLEESVPPKKAKIDSTSGDKSPGRNKPESKGDKKKVEVECWEPGEAADAKKSKRTSATENTVAPSTKKDDQDVFEVLDSEIEVEEKEVQELEVDLCDQDSNPPLMIDETEPPLDGSDIEIELIELDEWTEDV